MYLTAIIYRQGKVFQLLDCCCVFVSEFSDSQTLYMIHEQFETSIHKYKTQIRNIAGRVSINSKTDIFTSVKYVQHVQNCWCNRR